MDRRGFLKSGLAVSAVVAITRAGESADVFDAADPPFADVDTDSVKVIGPIFGEVDVHMRAYLNEDLVWDRIIEMPTMMDVHNDDLLIVLPGPAKVDIKFDKMIHINRLTAALPDFPVEAELYLQNISLPMFLGKGDVLTLQSNEDGLLRIMSDAAMEKREAEVLAR